MKSKLTKQLLIIIFIIYIIALLKLTIIRNGNFYLMNGKINAIPFYELYKILISEPIKYFLCMFIGNLIWFVPFGLLLPIITKDSLTFSKVVFYGFLLSLTIEISQYILGTGISELDDLILNTIGVAIGYILNRIGFKRQAS